MPGQMAVPHYQVEQNGGPEGVTGVADFEREASWKRRDICPMRGSDVVEFSSERNLKQSQTRVVPSSHQWWSTSNNLDE